MDFGTVLTAMITPMHADGSIDYSGAQQLAAYLLEHGSDGLVVCGTTGESATVHKEEKLKLFTAVREVTKEKKKMLIAGTGSNDTADSVELSKKAEAMGADAVLAVTPPYNKPPQEGLYRHFRAIAEAISLPVTLYNVPGRTALNLEPATVGRLAADVENIVALKEATGDMEQMTRLRAVTPPDFLIYCGEDSVFLPMLSLGACGVISVASHLIGPQLQEMAAAYQKGDTTRALELHDRYFHVFKKLFLCANPVPLKYALNRIGLPAGGYRLPLCEMDDTGKAQIDSMLREIGLL